MDSQKGILRHWFSELVGPSLATCRFGGPANTRCPAVLENSEIYGVASSEFSWDLYISGLTPEPLDSNADDDIIERYRLLFEVIEGK